MTTTASIVTTLTARSQFVAATVAQRATALGLAAVVSLGLLASMGQLADQQHDSAQLAAAPSIPTQLVVITAKRVQA